MKEDRQREREEDTAAVAAVTMAPRPLGKEQRPFRPAS